MPFLTAAFIEYGLVALVLVSVVATIVIYGRKHQRWSNGERGSVVSTDAAADRPRDGDGR